MLLSSRVSLMPAGDANTENNTSQPRLIALFLSSSNGRCSCPSSFLAVGQQSGHTLGTTKGSGQGTS